MQGAQRTEATAEKIGSDKAEITEVLKVTLLGITTGVNLSP